MRSMRTSCDQSPCLRRCVGPGRAGQVDRASMPVERSTNLCHPCPQPKMTEYDKRCCCLREIQQTEEKYTDTLGSIHQVRCAHGPCQRCLLPVFPKAQAALKLTILLSQLSDKHVPPYLAPLLKSQVNRGG